MYDDMQHQVRAPKPWIRWLLLLVVLTLLLVVGYVIGVNQAEIEQTVLDQEETSVTSETEQVDETETNATATEDTTDEGVLKTFTSSELAYSVKHPSSWFVEESSDKFSTITGTDNVVHYFKSKNVGSPLEMNVGQGDIWITVQRRDNLEKLSATEYAKKYPGAPKRPEERSFIAADAKAGSISDLLIDSSNVIQAAQQTIDTRGTCDGCEPAYLVTTYIPGRVEKVMYTVELLTNNEAGYEQNKAVYDNFLETFQVLN